MPTVPHRYGEQEARWVALETWTFKAAISAEEAAQLAANEQVLLYLGGVDTFATISINDEQVLETDNFHRCARVQLQHKHAMRNASADTPGAPLPCARPQVLDSARQAGTAHRC